MEASKIKEAYEAMRAAGSYTAYKDRKRHYERLLREARREGDGREKQGRLRDIQGR